MKKSISFIKMAGAGNDFIMIDAQKGLNLKQLAIKVCDRTNGIGADGLIVLDKSKSADYKMCIINADGSEAEMCGNGVRCLASYIAQIKKPKKKLFSIETLAGEILGEAEGEVANVRLTDPTDYRPDIKIEIHERKVHVKYIDTGVPHTIVFVENVNDIDVKEVGKIVRYHETFAPRGTNVNFVQIESNTQVNVRTYERGVEDETKACGTGSVAAGLMGYLHCNDDVMNKKGAKMNVRTRGGEILKVVFDIGDGKITNVWLKGSAKFIAKGEYYV